MNVRLIAWLTFGVLLGLFLGIVFGKGDLQAPFIVGTVGALFGLVGFFAVSAIHRASKLDTSLTNYPAILGALVGAVFGGIIGATSSLGRLMISIFNPDLLEWDFGTSFGAIGGAILGALFGACLSAAIAAFFTHLKTRHDETAEHNHGAGNST